MQPFCKDEDEYNHVLKAINDARDDANVEKEIASRIEAEFERRLVSCDLSLENRYFILSEVAEKWLEEAVPNSIKGNRIAYLRNLAAQGFTEKIDGKTQRILGFSQRGFLWNKHADTSPISHAKVVGYIRPKEVGIVIK